MELNTEVVKRKAGCEHRVGYHDDDAFVTIYHGTNGEEAHQQFRCTDDDGSTRPWVTEVIDWIRGLHERA